MTSSRSTGVAAGPSETPFVCLDACVFFQDEIHKDIKMCGPVVKFDRKEPIYSELEPATHCYRVLDGAVRLSRILSDGHCQILDICLPGDTFGIEISGNYTSTAEAIVETNVLKCSRSCIDKRSDGEHRHEMISMLSRNLCAAQDHIALLGNRGAKERLATFLIRQAAKQNRRENEAIELPISRQDMADYLGLTIETTCRTLSDFKNCRIISAPSRHQIVVRSFARLEEIATGAA